MKFCDIVFLGNKSLTQSALVFSRTFYLPALAEVISIIHRLECVELVPAPHGGQLGCSDAAVGAGAW